MTRHLDWDRDMNEEYSSLMKNHTWDLCFVPRGRKLVHCRWVYYTKYVVDGSIDRYKTHLVMNGFSLVDGIDYSETFSPMPKINYILLVLSLVASHG